MTIDEKYIDKLCLPNIKKVKDGVYRFKCVLCSLSEPNPNKWKGYLYLKGTLIITVVIDVITGVPSRTLLRNIIQTCSRNMNQKLLRMCSPHI